MANRFINNPGSPIKVIRSLKINEDGSESVVKVGEENFQEYIQSFEESSNIGALVARCAAGDTSAISTKTPIYGDFTVMPKTLAEMQQKIIDGKEYFEKLPAEIKNKFDNDFNKFIAESVTDDFVSKLGLNKIVEAAESVGETTSKVDGVVDKLVDKFTE